jgi:hypothetical protein
MRSRSALRPGSSERLEQKVCALCARDAVAIIDREERHARDARRRACRSSSRTSAAKRSAGSVRSVCGAATRRADRDREQYCNSRGHGICVVCTEIAKSIYGTE